MAITIKDLSPLIYDPTKMQQLVLNNISNFEIMDPTNPCVMLLEATTSIASASAAESLASIKKIYPSLASSNDDLLHHVSDKELQGLFSHPAETNLIIYLNARDLKNNGYAPNDPATGNPLGYVETVIPSGTEIIVTNIPFTILNDIVVKLYDTGVVFAEQGISPDPVAINSTGILAAGIVNFPDSEPWVMVEVLTKQVKKNIITRPVTVSEGFKLQVAHTDMYHYSEVFFRDTTTNNIWTKLINTHSDNYINPSIPTVFITVGDKLVIYEIPDVYLISGQVGGEIKIVMYETLGSLDLPIYKYPMSEYIVVPSQTPIDPANNVATATIANITMYANSRDTINGGTTGYTFPELKDAIINNTLGHEVLPITDSQLSRVAMTQGFEIYKIVDIITERIYSASRNIAKYDSDLVYAKPDVFFNTLSLETSSINNTTIIVDTNYIMVPSKTLFKEVNGIINILSDSEVTTLETLSDMALVTYLRTNNIFFTLYHYYIDTTSTDISATKVFDLDSPIMKNIRIIGKNTNIIPRANVGKYGIVRNSTGYKIVLTIITSKDLDNSNTNMIHGQLRIPTFDKGSYIDILGVYDPSLKTMTFDIATKFNILGDTTIGITNGISDIVSPFINISETATISIYTEDVGIVDSSNYYRSKIGISNNINNVTVIDVEDIVLVLGRSVKYIWNRMFITYTNNKYKKQLADKPKVYLTDIYEEDSVTGSTILIQTSASGVKSTYTNRLHVAGDPVLDGLGNPVYEYHKGDVILDSNQLPIIDVYSGVIRHLDMLMLEYEFLAANSLPATNYLNSIKDILNGWLFNDMAIINAKVLENTVALYKSYKKATPIDVNVGTSRVISPYKVMPVITLYSTSANYSTLEITNLQTTIGYILHDYLDRPSVNIAEIRTAILAAMDSSILSVKIDGLEISNNSEVFSMTNPSTRLTIDKNLELSTSDKLEVNYNVIVKVYPI